ncbi:MAG: response regulator [Candidatus Omnitrophota bacterium]
MITLLIVDDEKGMEEFAKPYFERRGCNVFYAPSGNKGLELFTTNNPDMVLLDLGLPDMDGREVLAKIKSSGRSTKVAILTGSSEEAVKDSVLPFGPDAYFMKPCKLPLILEQIEKWFKA